MCIFTTCCCTIGSRPSCSFNPCYVTSCDCTFFSSSLCTFIAICRFAIYSFTWCSFTIFNFAICIFTSCTFTSRSGASSCGPSICWARVFYHADLAWGASQSSSEQTVTHLLACLEMFPSCALVCPSCFARIIWGVLGRPLGFMYVLHVATSGRSLTLWVCHCSGVGPQATHSKSNQMRLTQPTFASSQAGGWPDPVLGRTGSGPCFRSWLH